MPGHADTISQVVSVNAHGVVDQDLPCTTCGVNLRGRAATGTCIRCGDPVQRTIDRHTPHYATAEDGRLDESVACRVCGYNLRGTRPTDACPECGHDVAASMRSDLLGHMSPAWLRKLRLGLILMFASLALAIVGGVLLGAVSTALAVGTATGTGSQRYIVGMGVAMTAWQVVVCGTLWLVGVFMFTTPEPGGLRAGDERPARLARWGEGVRFVVGLLLGLTTMAAMTGGWVGVGGSMWFNAALNLAAMVAGTISLLGLYLFAGRLFTRAPSVRLATQCRRVAWGFVVFGAVAGVGQVVNLITLNHQINQQQASATSASSSQAAAAQAGQAVPGGTVNTNTRQLPGGSSVTTTTTTYPDGSTLTQTETTDADGSVTNTTSYASHTSASMSMSAQFTPLRIVTMALQVIGGLGLLVLAIWGLVLSILLYRRLIAAIKQAASRERPSDHQAVAGALTSG